MTKRVTIEALAEWLRDKDDIALFGHVNPDGDAVGSTLALWLALKSLGKRAVVCLPEGVTRLYAHLPGADQIVPTGEALPFVPKTAFAVDVSEFPRLGEAGMAAFEACEYRAVLDHHSTNEGFGQVMLLDGKAAAAGELALAVIEALGVRLTREMAECLFVAISTDCGHFNYTNTRPQTFEAAAKCAAAGIDIETITSRLYRTRSFGRTKLLGLVLAGLQVSEDGRMAWAKLSEAMLEEAGALPEDNEGVVNYLLEINGVQFAVLANERGSQTKLSLRSKPPLDVAAAVAIPLGGGGHACAAGANVDADMDEALRRALVLAEVALKGETAPDTPV